MCILKKNQFKLLLIDCLKNQSFPHNYSISQAYGQINELTIG